MKTRTNNRITWPLIALLAGVQLVGSSSSRIGAPPCLADAPLRAQQGGRDRQIVQMDVSVERPSAAPFVLKLVLKYTGDKEAVIYTSSLPCENAYSLILTAVEADATGTPLDRYFPIDDPGPSTMTVKPGQVLLGEIDLTRRFRNLARAAQQRDVILFWSYQFRTIAGVTSSRVGGWLVIPKAARTRSPAGFDLRAHGAAWVE